MTIIHCTSIMGQVKSLKSSSMMDLMLGYISEVTKLMYVKVLSPLQNRKQAIQCKPHQGLRISPVSL